MSIQNLSRQILFNHNRESTGFRKDYFDYLTRSSGCYVQPGDYCRDEKEPAEIESFPPGIELLNRIYGLLEPYTIELARVARDRSFVITATQPAFFKEESKAVWPYRASQMVQIYRCRFASRSLSASLRLKDKKIEFFIIPACQTMRLSEAEDEYGSLMIFEYLENKFDDGWWVEGKPLTDERLEKFCLYFFDYFVKNSEKLILDELSA